MAEPGALEYFYGTEAEQKPGAVSRACCGTFILPLTLFPAFDL